MNTIRSGEILLRRYNKENGTSLSPKEFFCDVIAPLLFYGEKYLVNWTNSKFFQYKKDLDNHKKELNEETFREVVNDFCVAIDNPTNNVLTTLNIFGGCAKPEYKQTTMFCYSDNLDFDVNERYLSFIGSVVALQIEGWNCLIYNEDIIWGVFLNIYRYKETLLNNHHIEDKQLYAWNTICLFNQYCGNIDTICDEYIDSKGKLNVSKKIVFSNFIYLLLQLKQDIKLLDFFAIGQQNKSCSTIVFDLEYVTSQSKLYKRIYDILQVDFRYADFNKLFGGKNLFYKAIETGSISKGFFNPLMDVKGNDKKDINKNRLVYIDLIMTKEQKEMAKILAKKVKERADLTQRKVYDPNKHIFKVSNKTTLIENITTLPNPKELKDVFDMINQETFTKEKMREFLAISNFYYRTME